MAFYGLSECLMDLSKVVDQELKKDRQTARAERLPPWRDSFLSFMESRLTYYLALFCACILMHKGGLNSLVAHGHYPMAASNKNFPRDLEHHRTYIWRHHRVQYRHAKVGCSGKPNLFRCSYSLFTEGSYPDSPHCLAQRSNDA